LHGGVTSFSELCKLACRILTIPTSSAVSECNWSAFSYIHDKKRNRLTSEKDFKLVYIYSNYKLKLSQIEKNNTNFNENENFRDNIFDNLNENDDRGSDNNDEDIISDEDMFNDE